MRSQEGSFRLSCHVTGPRVCPGSADRERLPADEGSVHMSVFPPQGHPGDVAMVVIPFYRVGNCEEMRKNYTP